MEKKTGYIPRPVNTKILWQALIKFIALCKTKYKTSKWYHRIAFNLMLGYCIVKEGEICFGLIRDDCNTDDEALLN